MHTNTSEHLSNGSSNDLQNSTTVRRKPLTVSASDDVSMLIETVSGKLVNVTDPNANDICLQDIAWATSRIPRFAGHTITGVPYNVAQHSVYVSQLLEQLLENDEDFAPESKLIQALTFLKRIAPPMSTARKELLMKALLHDAHEAYIGDIPSPVKKIPELAETFRLIEGKLDHAILLRFNLSEVLEEEKIVIKYCDKLAQAIEGYQFMPSRGLNWVLPKPSLVMLQSFQEPREAIKSYEDFISRYDYLRDQ